MVDTDKKGKPFWKSKGFWGGVISVATVFVPPPLQPIVAATGGLLGMVGRAQAKGPLKIK